MIKIENSVVYPDRWWIRIDKTTHEVGVEDIKELIREAKRIVKEWK